MISSVSNSGYESMSRDNSQMTGSSKGYGGLCPDTKKNGPTLQALRIGHREIIRTALKNWLGQYSETQIGSGDSRKKPSQASVEH